MIKDTTPAMRIILFTLILALSLAMSGCTDRAEEIYETARLEERQRALDHAESLYEEILENYPDSEYAAKARERLSVIRSGD